MRTRFFALVMALAVGAYIVLAGAQAYLFATHGGLAGAVLGIAIAIIGLLGLWLIIKEVRFGLVMQRMGQRAQELGLLLPDDLPRLPSGRAETVAADERWLQAKSACDEQPDSWIRWYHLALAYDDARDRKRARAAMREAAALFSAAQ